MRDTVAAENAYRLVVLPPVRACGTDLINEIDRALVGARRWERRRCVRDATARHGADTAFYAHRARACRWCKLAEPV